MSDDNSLVSLRLCRLPIYAKVTLTLFLALVGVGYLVAVLNIQMQHHMRDLEPGMSLDDLRAAYHGLEKPVTSDLVMPSVMLEVVLPGGSMRRHLDQGGPREVRALVSWLEDGAQEEYFDQPAVYHPDDPSAREVIARRCVTCHRADGGDKADLPYAASSIADPEYALVAVTAAPVISQETEIMHISPSTVERLVLVTHMHILSIPVFTLIVAALFMGTGWGSRFKLLLGPLPMLAIVIDMASWWLARPIEGFIYLIAAAGALFGVSYGAQIVLVVFSLWFGKPSGKRA